MENSAEIIKKFNDVINNMIIVNQKQRNDVFNEMKKYWNEINNMIGSDANVENKINLFNLIINKMQFDYYDSRKVPVILPPTQTEINGNENPMVG